MTTECTFLHFQGPKSINGCTKKITNHQKSTLTTHCHSFLSM